MNKNDGRAQMDAMLRHLGCGQDLRDFPGTKIEILALTRTAGSRGLIAWQKARGRYELTPIGWSQLTPRRQFGLASLMVSTVIGATVGAAALAVLWLPVDVSHHSIRGQSTASVSFLEKPIAALASRSADVGVRSPAPPQRASASQDAPSAVAHDLGPSAAPGNPIEPPMVADQPVPEQPSAEADPTSVKQAAVKKSRRKTAHRRRKEQTGPTWAYANPRRARQGSWFANR
jgi:hypothetical protein